MMFAPLDEPTMARIFSSFDVLLNCSAGEGFGVPIIEAAACGVPSIVTDFSAMPEVAGPSPWKVRGRPYWTGQASWMQIPDVGEMVGALEESYAMSEVDRARLSKQVREHALDYAVPKVYREHMAPAIEEIQDRIGMREPVRIAA